MPNKKHPDTVRLDWLNKQGFGCIGRFINGWHCLPAVGAHWTVRKALDAAILSEAKREKK